MEPSPVVEPAAAIEAPVSVAGGARRPGDGPAPITRPAAPPRPKTASTATKRPKSKASTFKWPAQASCPYCAQLLVPAPTTHKRCPRCRQRVMVRRVDDRVAFLTEAVGRGLRGGAAARRREPALDRAPQPWIRLAEAADAPAGQGREGQRELATPESRLRRAIRVLRRRRPRREGRRAPSTTGRLPSASGAPRRSPCSKAGRLADPAAGRRGRAAPGRGGDRAARDPGARQGGRARRRAVLPAVRRRPGHIYRINAELHEARLPHADCPSGLCACRWRLSDRDRANLERLLRGGARA